MPSSPNRIISLLQPEPSQTSRGKGSREQRARLQRHSSISRAARAASQRHQCLARAPRGRRQSKGLQRQQPRQARGHATAFGRPRRPCGSHTHTHMTMHAHTRARRLHIRAQHWTPHTGEPQHTHRARWRHTAGTTHSTPVHTTWGPFSHRTAARVVARVQAPRALPTQLPALTSHGGLREGCHPRKAPHADSEQGTLCAGAPHTRPGTGLASRLSAAPTAATAPLTRAPLHVASSTPHTIVAKDGATNALTLLSACTQRASPAPITRMHATATRRPRTQTYSAITPSDVGRADGQLARNAAASPHIKHEHEEHNAAALQAHRARWPPRPHLGSPNMAASVRTHTPPVQAPARDHRRGRRQAPLPSTHSACRACCPRQCRGSCTSSPRTRYEHEDHSAAAIHVHVRCEQPQIFRSCAATDCPRPPNSIAVRIASRSRHDSQREEGHERRPCSKWRRRPPLQSSCLARSAAGRVPRAHTARTRSRVNDAAPPHRSRTSCLRSPAPPERARARRSTRILASLHQAGHY